jgi:aspartyl/asparaginyl-tRNA synthetase
MADHENAKGPKTFAELKQMINEITKEDKVDDDIFWFVNFQEASNILDNYRTKDLASDMMGDGLKGIKTKKAVKEWFDNQYEVLEDGTEYWYTDFPKTIRQFYYIADDGDNADDGDE